MRQKPLTLIGVGMCMLVAACSNNGVPTAPSIGSSLLSTNSVTEGEVLTVVIPEHGPYPEFRAKPGSTVTFLFPEYPDAEIYFVGDSPFARTEFPVGTGQKVMPNAQPGTYHYYVEYGDDGNGTGEIIPLGNGSGEVIQG